MYNLISQFVLLFESTTNSTSSYTFLSIVTDLLSYWIGGKKQQVRSLTEEMHSLINNNPWAAWSESGKLMELDSKNNNDEIDISSVAPSYLRGRRLTGSESPTSLPTGEPTSQPTQMTVEGSEFQINSGIWLQGCATIAALTDGGFVVTWQIENKAAPGADIFGQRFDSIGSKSGEEFLVNTYVGFHQYHAGVAVLTNGDFVVVWNSWPASSEWDIFGQRYSAAGDRNGQEFQINTHTTSTQDQPVVAALKEGGFVVVWRSYGEDGNSWGSFGQQYTNAGIKNGSEFQINSYFVDDQDHPAVAGFMNDGFVVTWQSNDQDGSGWGVYAQRFASNGVKNGLELQVNNYTFGNQITPNVATFTNGNFAVTWSSYDQNNATYAVFIQLFTNSGVKIGTELQVNDQAIYIVENTLSYAKIVTLANDDFIVVWLNDGEDCSNRRVCGQRYRSTGAKIDHEFQINTDAYPPINQDPVTITALMDGGFVVVWSSTIQNTLGCPNAGDNRNVIGQRFNANGNKVALFPTSQPTSYPTAWPILSPFSWPTFQPTSLPTGEPTSQPTQQPTFYPTARPTLSPFSWPTSQPTNKSDPRFPVELVIGLSTSGLVAIFVCIAIYFKRQWVYQFVCNKKESHHELASVRPAEIEKEKIVIVGDTTSIFSSNKVTPFPTVTLSNAEPSCFVSISSTQEAKMPEYSIVALDVITEQVGDQNHIVDEVVEPIKQEEISSPTPPAQESFSKNDFTIDGHQPLLIEQSAVILGKKLGKGSFGAVYEAEWRFQTVAVKCYVGDKLPQRIAREVRQEMGIMLRLQHDCLIRFHGLVHEEDSPPMLVMEYAAGGSLYFFLQSDEEISWNLRLRIAHEIARGLAYLHAENIIHADLKSLNVVLDKELHAKLCDFGLAQLRLHSQSTVKDENAKTHAGGTVRWMAPELFSHDTSFSTKASDVWALGMVLFEIASREVPFKNTNKDAQLINLIKESQGEAIPEESVVSCPGFGEVMKRCWLERHARPSAADIVGNIRDLVLTTSPQFLSKGAAAQKISLPPIQAKSNQTPSFNQFCK